MGKLTMIAFCGVAAVTKTARKAIRSVRTKKRILAAVIGFLVALNWFAGDIGTLLDWCTGRANVVESRMVKQKLVAIRQPQSRNAQA